VKHAQSPYHHGTHQVSSAKGFEKSKAEREKARQRKKILTGVGIALVVLIAGAALYLMSYLNQLNNRFELEEDLSPVLVETPANEPFYVLVLGSDSREGTANADHPTYGEGEERSDTMMLVRVDASKKLMTMLSIPRDTPYTLPDDSVIKINEVYNMGGASASIQAVSELTGVSIAHYAEIHFSELQKLVDDLGGVEVTVPVDITVKDALTGEEISLEAGKQVLNGQQAQAFARARHEYTEGEDVTRQDNVRVLGVAILKKILDKPSHQMPEALLGLAECTRTDLRSGELLSLALTFANGADKPKVYTGTGPYSGALNKDGLWMCYENPEGWAAIMKIVDAGKNPSKVDVEDTAIIPKAKKKSSKK